MPTSWSGAWGIAPSATSSVTPIRRRRWPPSTSRSSECGRSAPLTALTEGQRAEARERFHRWRPHVEEGVHLARLAGEQGLPLRTAQRWVAQYQREGLAG